MPSLPNIPSSMLTPPPLLQATELARKLADDLKAERALSSGLLERTQDLQNRLDVASGQKAEADEKVVELEEMMKDLMFSLEARDTLKDGEAAGGDLVVQQKPTSSSRRKTTRR